jgi:2-methylaconitate cis-trans-isomerase PrpF
VEVSCIDAGNPVCVVRSRDLGVDGTILPDAMEAHPDLLQRLEAIRCQASVAMGLSKDIASVYGSIPKIVMVSPPVSHRITSGDTLPKEDIDLVVRAISVGQPHRAVPITVAMVSLPRDE